MRVAYDSEATQNVPKKKVRDLISSAAETHTVFQQGHPVFIVCAFIDCLAKHLNELRFLLFNILFELFYFSKGLVIER
jgi:hypothetical protein